MDQECQPSTQRPLGECAVAIYLRCKCQIEKYLLLSKYILKTNGTIQKIVDMV